MYTPVQHRSRARVLFAFAAHLLLASVVVAQSSAPATDPKKKEEEIVVLDAFSVGSLGLTPGGFQDIGYARELLRNGMLPLPNEVTAEGLFSEHDLPLSTVPASRLIEITGMAMPATIPGKPEVAQLAQIGFSSSLTPETFHRDPLFLTIVLDVSGSMEPYFGLVKDSVKVLLGKLREGDAVSIVTFSEESAVELEPVNFDRASWPGVIRLVDTFAIRGGTNIAEGLKQGVALAKNRPAGFSGRSRVVLITDAMPNIDETEPEEFMRLATDASLAGVGLTTIGLNIEFDADFVRKVSSVSGGNAVWFADATEMRRKLEEDFDFLVTEVAFDLEMRVTPTHGHRVESVYGVPGDTFAKTPDGGVVMDIPTLFLSREEGAIFFSFVGDQMGVGESVGRVELSYTPHGQSELVRESFAITLVEPSTAAIGLKRGHCLVSEFEALQAAGRAFYDDNRIRAARGLVGSALVLLEESGDPDLRNEGELLKKVNSFLVAAEAEPRLSKDFDFSNPELASLIGVWSAEAKSGKEPTRWVFLPEGTVITVSREDGKWHLSESNWDKEGVGDDGDGKLKFRADSEALYLTGKDQETRLTRVAVDD